MIKPILAQNKQFIVKADAFLFEFVKKVSAFSYICFRIIGESSGNTDISVEKLAKKQMNFFVKMCWKKRLQMLYYVCKRT